MISQLIAAFLLGLIVLFYPSYACKEKKNNGFEVRFLFHSKQFVNIHRTFFFLLLQLYLAGHDKAEKIEEKIVVSSKRFRALSNPHEYLILLFFCSLNPRSTPPPPTSPSLKLIPRILFIYPGVCQLFFSLNGSLSKYSVNFLQIQKLFIDLQAFLCGQFLPREDGGVKFCDVLFSSKGRRKVGDFDWVKKKKKKTPSKESLCKANLYFFFFLFY